MFKFRWLDEERAIIREAYHRGYALKVIANGLARTESSVNKQLKRDNIRAGSDRRQNPKIKKSTQKMTQGKAWRANHHVDDKTM